MHEEDESSENSIKLAEKKIKLNQQALIDQKIHKYDFSLKLGDIIDAAPTKFKEKLIKKPNW